MNEHIDNAKEELKRIDHLIYVTLKYTRTVDVFISIMERMVGSYEHLIEALLVKAREDDKTQEEPDNPISRADLIMKIYTSPKVKKNIKRYLLFRKLRRADHEKENEFRRHVTMTAFVGGEIAKVTIDTITEDFHMLKDFINYVDTIVS